MSTTAIAMTYPEIPTGFTVGSASLHDLQRAGFHGGPDASKSPSKRSQPVDLAQAILHGSTYRVMRDGLGNIVATWDEGRWWTPQESDAFTAQIIRVMKHGRITPRGSRSRTARRARRQR